MLAASPRDFVNGLPAKRVLVVDDNRVAADSCATLLRVMGYESMVAYDGQSALLAASEFLPDAVLLDLALPDGDGFGFAQQLRQVFGDKVRIVALSGFDQNQFPTAFSESSFDAHILKPATADALERTLFGPR